MAGGIYPSGLKTNTFACWSRHITEVHSDGGIEVPPAKVKQADPASQNGQISQGGAGLVLGLVLMDAAKSKLSWLRWQTVDGKQVAVFGFDVAQEAVAVQDRLLLFPERSNVGSAVPMGGSGITDLLQLAE